MDVLTDARALAPTLTELRHELHRWPEVGLELPRTQQAVLAALEGLGLEIATGSSCSSVTAVLRGGAPAAGDDTRSNDGPPEGIRAGDGRAGGAGNGDRRRVVLLRGDMDALPVHEDLDLPFRSQVDGVMHACGHDLHTAMLVGAARLLAARREELAGDVVFMFQPGEEGFDGAGHMIADGVLTAAGHRPDAAFALHVLSNLTPRGMVASRPGAFMAASDGVSVEVRGNGGHGSSPHLARDPVPATCAMVLALQTAITREIDALSPAVLSVGTLHAGTKRNVIPDTATFEATVRTFDPQVQARLRNTVDRVCQGVAAAHGVDVEVRHIEEYPVTVNDGAETEYALGVARRLFGTQHVMQIPSPIMGSEDFSRVIAEVPGAMLFLGAMMDGADPEQAPSNHSPRATFDDDVLPLGAALYAALAAERLPLTTHPIP